MAFYGGRAMRGFGVLPTFDLAADPAYLGTLSAKIGQVQAISAGVAPLAAHPEGAVLKGEVDGLEQQISGAVADLSTAVQAVASAAARISSPDGDHPLGKPEPTTGKNAQQTFNRPGGGQLFQDTLKAWRATGNNALLYKPDNDDYQYPGGAGQFQNDTTNWMQAQRDAANSKMSVLGALLDQYIKTVPVAGAAVSKVLDAQQAVTTTANVAQAAATAVDATNAQAQLAQAQVNLATTAKAAQKAIADVNSPDNTPMIIAAVGIPLAGIAAYFLLRKKKPSGVAGYRRRRSRR